jgi:hypothetical protein
MGSRFDQQYVVIPFFGPIRTPLIGLEAAVDLISVFYLCFRCLLD